VYFSRARYWLSASGLVTREPARGGAGGAQRVARGALVVGRGGEQVLGGDVLVLEPLGLLLGPLEQLLEPVAHVGLGSALHPGDGPELVLEAALHLAGVRADALEEGLRHAVLLVEQGEEEVLEVDGLVLALAGLGLGLLERFLGLHGQLFGSHVLRA